MTRQPIFRALTVWCAICLGAMLPGSVASYTIATGASDPCHESLTGQAYRDVILNLPIEEQPVPDDKVWKSVAEALLERAGFDRDEISETLQFILVSLIIGARSPDTDGHSVFNLENLRLVHADPDAEGQYAHALRGADDDFAEGDAIAVDGTRRVIGDLVEEALASLEDPLEDQIITEEIYFDFYGLVDIQVWSTFFHLGRASHVVQDSFAHTIRTEQSGFQKIATVLNYIDAISSSFKEERDGLAHSDATDLCFDSRAEERTQAVSDAMIDFYGAVRQLANNEDPFALDNFLDAWLTLEPGCTLENDYCDNAPWLELAREDATGPYLKEIFGCSVTGAPGATSGPAFGAILLFALVLALTRTRRSSRTNQ